MILKLIKKVWPLLVIWGIILIFFSNLFFPTQSTFINPDYGRSDLVHFNIPLRKVTSEAIKAFQIPFWEPKIGQGFPLIDEGQIGFFYIPNLLIFTLLPFWLAFNIGYLFTFFLAALGTYLLTRSLGLGKTSSLLASLTYTFSPILILRLHHYNLIQSVAIFPLLLFFTNVFFKTRKPLYLGLFALALSQQILAGFQQITLYSTIAVCLFFLYKLKYNFEAKKSKHFVLAIFTASILTGILISSIQINQTYTLIKNSLRLQSQNPSKILSDFPYNPQNLLTAVNPYILGDARDASYPRWSSGFWGLFWENNTYFGLVQLLLLPTLAFLLLINKQKKKSIDLYFFALLAILGVFLALGKYGPLHPLFSIPPISFFRVPSRFLVYFFLSAAILASYSLELLTLKFKSKPFAKLLSGLVIAVVVFDIFRVWQKYPLTVETELLVQQPQFTKIIHPGDRIASFGQTELWNKTFLTSGWSTGADDYLFSKNLLDQNLNLIHETNNIFAYSAMSPRRISYTEGILKAGIGEAEGRLQISIASKNILDMNSVKYLTTTMKIEGEDKKLVDSVKKGADEIYLYENSDALSHVFAVSDYKIANNLNEATAILLDENFDPKKTAILEKTPPLKSGLPQTRSELKIIDYTNNKVTISADLETEALLVLSDSYYPGWKASVDGQEKEIYATNINSRSVIAPEGKHIIEFKYVPERFYHFALVSLVSLITLVMLIVKYKNYRV